MAKPEIVLNVDVRENTGRAFTVDKHQRVLFADLRAADLVAF